MSNQNNIQQLISDLEKEQGLEYKVPEGYFETSKESLLNLKKAKRPRLIRMLPLISSMAACLLIALWFMFPKQETSESDWLMAYMDTDGYLWMDEELIIEALDFEEEIDLDLYADIETDLIEDFLTQE